jgi:Tfp pilus assembly protein FimT
LTAEPIQQKVANERELGYSLAELMVVVLIFVILLSLAVPSLTTITRNVRLMGDARGIAAQLNLARMRAASLGTPTRVNYNLSANTYQIEFWNKGTSVYQLEGGAQKLSQGVVFGYGSITTPAGQQSSIAQGYPGETGCTCIYFNSRGIATDNLGNATANSAIYIGNSQGFYAVAVSIAGQPTTYRGSGSTWVSL